MFYTNRAGLRRRDFLATVGGLAAAGLLARHTRAADEPRPLVILYFGGDLPQVYKDLSREYALKALKGGQDPKKKGDEQDNVVGLEQLAEADVWVGSANKRTFPSAEQLAHFKKF